MEVLNNATKTVTENETDYLYRDLTREEFDETKAGVKGLVDSGVTKIPRIFIHPPEVLQDMASVDAASVGLRLPVINLQEGITSRQRVEIVNEIREASETLGLFYIVNHGIPGHVIDQMLDCVRKFHDQPKELKMPFYSRSKRVRYYSNVALHMTEDATWRDTFTCDFEDDTVDPEILPSVCRNAIGEYVKCIARVKDMLSELLSEALGLSSSHLSDMECMDGFKFVCNYYPPCPEPDLTLGAPKHSDTLFLTILSQDTIGGLQILCQNMWVDVPPLQGSLVVNIADLLQVITNGKFKSVEHRVVAGRVGPRVSTACIFRPSDKNKFKPYGPLKELLSDGDSPLYRETTVSEYVRYPFLCAVELSRG